MASEGNGATVIHIRRQAAYSASAVPFSVRIDGHEVDKISQNQDVTLAVAPGEHRIQLVLWSRQGSKTQTFWIQPGQQLYFVCKGSLNPLYPIEMNQSAPFVVGSLAAPPPPPNPYGQQPPSWAQPPPNPQDFQNQQPRQQSQQDRGQSQPTRVEVIETEQYEEPLAEEVRVIDNQHSATGISRSMRASREWTRTMSIGADRTRTYGGELGGGVAWLKVKASVEAELHSTYSSESQAKQTFAEEFTITVPARTNVRLVLRWKRIWQRGVVRVTEGDGSVFEVPYQVVVNVTFDQTQQDAVEDAVPAARPNPDDMETQAIPWQPPASAG